MCCLVACNRAEEGLIGRVVKVSDGDTITVLDSSKTQHKIRLQGMNIISLSENLGAVSLRPPVSPLLLPGTNYILWTLIVVGVLLLFGICFVLAKMRAIQEAWYNLRERLGLIRMSQLTRRHLKKLAAKKCSDVEYATEWQKPSPR